MSKHGSGTFQHLYNEPRGADENVHCTSDFVVTIEYTKIEHAKPNVNSRAATRLSDVRVVLGKGMMAARKPILWKQGEKGILHAYRSEHYQLVRFLGHIFNRSSLKLYRWLKPLYCFLQLLTTVAALSHIRSRSARQARLARNRKSVFA